MPWGDLPRAEHTAPDGIIVIDKDQGVTSHDVVGAVRRLAGTRKVGHAGTLDPMATGLLTIGVGKATRLLNYLMGCNKTYRTTICLGVSTTTEDAEGEPIFPAKEDVCPDFFKVIQRFRVGESQADTGDNAEIYSRLRQARESLLGEIDQVPSLVSAIKIDGKRAYERVRDGEEFIIPARRICIDRFDFLSELRAGPVISVGGNDFPTIEIDAEVTCSAGTYIRALARDFGATLGMPAHIRMLRRIKVGDFDVANAYSVAQLNDILNDKGEIPVIPLAQAAGLVMATASISKDQKTAISFGQFIEIPEQSYPVALVCDDELVAIGEKRGKKTRPVVVFSSRDG